MPESRTPEALEQIISATILHHANLQIKGVTDKPLSELIVEAVKEFVGIPLDQLPPATCPTCLDNVIRLAPGIYGCSYCGAPALNLKMKGAWQVNPSPLPLLNVVPTRWLDLVNEAWPETPEPGPLNAAEYEPK